MSRRIIQRPASTSDEDDDTSAALRILRNKHASGSTSTLTESEVTNATELQSIRDNVDDAEFGLAVCRLADSIREEMRTYGDSEEDRDDLRSVEFRIQSERILRLVDECLEDIRFGFVLPLMFHERRNGMVMELVDEMTETDKNAITDLWILLDGNPEFIMDNLIDLQPKLENALCVAERCGLKAFVPEYLEKLPANALTFLDTLTEFQKMAKLRVFWTAPKAMAKEKRLYAMWMENQATRDLVADMHVKVDAAQRKIQNRKGQNEEVMTEYQKKLQLINDANHEKIQRTIHTSDLKMNKTSIESEHKQHELLVRFNAIKEDYESMLRDNLVADKKLRESKLKMQQKVLSWVQKYDTEVGERSKELFALRDKLEEERNEFKKWTQKFEEQEVEYLDVEAKILAEWIQQRDEKMRLFTLNYAARVVQRAFRKMLKKRKAMRKKKGKGKKKK